MEMNKDPKLLEGYRAGETWAYEKLYLTYGEQVRRFLAGGFSFVSRGRTCRYRGNAAGIDADGIVQETFARAFLASTRRNYDGERPFRNYLFSIAKNLVLREFQRRERVLNTDNAEEATDVLARRGTVTWMTSQDGDPEEQLAEDQLQAVTQRFIASLADEEMQFFNHRFATELTQEATARVMDVTRARVKLLEKNLRRRFLVHLRDNGYFIGYDPRPRWARERDAA